MAKCVCIKHELNIVETGAMDCYVTIYDRQIIPPQGTDNTDFNIQFVNPYNTWGYFKSRKGILTLDDANIADDVTDLFFMRYNPDILITSEKWLQYKDKYFRIEKVTNLNHDDRFLMLELKERGEDDDEGNFA